MTALNFIKRFLFQHPFFIYIFILPVYTPIRILGEDFPVYHSVIPGDADRIFYFLFVFFQVGISSLMLSLMVSYVKEKADDLKILNWKRTFALLLALVFVISTYCLLFPHTKGEMFIVTGFHYFCIANLGGLAMLETKHYKLPFKLSSASIARAIGSSIIGINVNILGIGAFVLVYITLRYFNIGVKAYSYFCVGLEILLFIYLLLYKDTLDMV